MKRVWPSLACLILTCALTSCRQRIASVPVYKGLLTVGPDWVEFPLAQPLNAQWRWQVVQVTVNTHYESSINPIGLKLENGTVTTPEIDATTDLGTHYRLPLQSFQNATSVSFETSEVKIGTRFAQLRMRSSEPITVSGVTWISYMPEDTKTGYP